MNKGREEKAHRTQPIDTVPKEKYNKLLEALKGITKYDKPMPDPHVHGWEVFAKAAMEMASDKQFKAIKAIAEAEGK